MADIVDKKTRSRMMSSIRSKNTKIEIIIRKFLWKKGFRYRLHDSKLVGKPDIIFPKYRAIIFINGCFWHGHDCSLFKLPKTRTDFWQKKIFANKNNQIKFYETLFKDSWRILTVWECALKGKSKIDINLLINMIEEWLRGSIYQLDIRGNKN